MAKWRAIMNDKQGLIQHTNDFFNLHWGFDSKAPCWDFSWNWCGAVTNYHLGGLYALFNGENLIYIGLGSSRGGGLYQDRGISRRLMAHVLRNAPKDMEVSYIPRERWKKLGVDVVATLGFPEDKNYLALALEDYLIGRTNPPENRNKRIKKT